MSQWFPLPNLERKTADGSFLELTPIPSTSLTYCAPDSKVFVCYDAFLGMDFRYPAFMEQLTSTVLRWGVSTGYAINYTFEDAGSMAGGRSLDFREGREPVVTDTKGFEDHSAEEMCAGWSGNSCTIYNSRIFLNVLLPQPEWYCRSMSIPIFPQGSVTIDLPAHPIIKGFTFSFLLLPSESVATFQHQWFGNDACESETKAALHDAMEQLMLDLLAGTADPEIQQRYDTLFALAASIQSPYIATNP